MDLGEGSTGLQELAEENFFQDLGAGRHLSIPESYVLPVAFDEGSYKEKILASAEDLDIYKATDYLASLGNFTN